MLFCLIPVLLLTGSAAALSLHFKKHFADLLAPVVFGIMLLLYGFYGFGLLNLGRILVTVLLLLTVLVPLILRRPNKSRIAEFLKTPSFLLYLVGVAACMLFAANKFVSLWDCLRLWGAYPKALHTTGALQLGPDALLFDVMQSYPPGMPLLASFMTGFSPVFPENGLFFTYNFFGLSVLLPFLKAADSSDKKTSLWALLLVLFVPYFLTGMNTDQGYYYSSLYIDIPLGLCCGWFFSRVFHPKNKLDAISAVLSCGATVLLKDSGAFFALCGILGGLICQLLEKNNIKKYLPWLLCQAAILALTYGGWKYLTGLYTVENHIQSTFTIPSVLTLARLFFFLLRTPVTGIFTLTGAIGFSLPAVLLILFIAKLLMAWMARPTSMKAEIAEVAVELICFVCFFAGWCFSFLGEISEQSYPSYERYFCTLVICTLYVVVYDGCFRYRETLAQLKAEVAPLFQGDTNLARFLQPARQLLLIGMALAMVFSAGLILFDFPSRQSDFCVQADSAAAAITDVAQEGDVYLAIPGDSNNNSRLHHRIYFELLDDGLRVKNFYPEADISVYTPESFLELLQAQNYDYVMLTYIDEALLAQFGELFSGAALEECNLVYQVTSTGLVRVN